MIAAAAVVKLTTDVPHGQPKTVAYLWDIIEGRYWPKKLLLVPPWLELEWGVDGSGQNFKKAHSQLKI